MIILGLTGSIGMGKTTTAEMFKAHGIPVWDADKAVAALYEQGGAAVEKISEIFPHVIKENRIDRSALRAAVEGNNAAIEKLNAIVHPLVAEDRQAFLSKHKHAETPIVLLDIPLLFESKLENAVDYVIVVSVAPSVQRKRVLARAKMTPSLFNTLLERQMPDAQKRAQADFIVETHSLASANKQVEKILDNVRKAHA